MFLRLAPKQGYHKKKKQRVKRITLVCLECKKEYEVYPYEENTRKFCSRTCSSRYHNRKRKTRREVTKECEYCGETFTRIVMKSKKEPRYCCTDCANKNREILKRERLIKQMESEFNELMCDV